MRNQRKLSDAQAREVRLSMEGHKPLAKRLGLDPTVIQRIRGGTSYGPLRLDEREAQAERLYRAAHPELPRLNDYLLIVGDQRIRGGSMDRQEAMDAAYECSHGRLSHDSSPACGCWPGELAPVVVLPVDRASVLVAA